MLTILQDPSDKPARGILHTIRRCNYCGELLGTRAAWRFHNPKRIADRCRSAQTMRRKRAWQGHGGIWWTTDLGWGDESLSLPIEGAETRVNTGPELGQCGELIAKPQPRCLTKLRGALS